MAINADLLLIKYPQCVPIIIEPANKSAPKIDKNKYIVPKDLKVSEFICIVRKHIQIDSHKAIFIFVNEGTLIPSNITMADCHETYQKDGFLYIKYALENTFG